MSDQDTTPATIQEVRAACSGASNDFIVGQLEKGATVAQAVQAYNADLVAENQKLKSKAETTNRRPAIKGVTPLQEIDSEAGAAFSGGNAKDEWNSQLNELIKGGMPRGKAVTTLAKRHPELREALVAEANA